MKDYGNMGMDYGKGKSEAPCRPGITKGTNERGKKQDVNTPPPIKKHPNIPGMSNQGYVPHSRS